MWTASDNPLKPDLMSGQHDPQAWDDHVEDLGRSGPPCPYRVPRRPSVRYPGMTWLDIIRRRFGAAMPGGR